MSLIFDFDGVLANSEPLHLAAYQEVLSPLGITMTREDYYARYLGYDDAGVFRMVAEAAGWQMDAGRLAALIAEKGRVFDAVIESTDVLYPGAAECVERMAGAFPLGIASGALRYEIEAVLKRSGLDRHFRFIVAAGDTPQSKPAPDPYRRAAELHGVPPARCVAIEDSRWGIESAKSAGLACIAITTTYPRAALTTADLIIESLDEITPELLASLNR
jgi:beta-phosphoglucomutase-like phosphatase (HAD superfamily)